jgi:hypothetical protein
MRLFSCILALFLATLANAAELRQIVPPPGKSLAVLEAPASRGTWVCAADEDLTTVAPQLLADGGIAILIGTPGRYLVRWRAGPLKPWQKLTVDLGVPPGPEPKPEPEPPKPEPIPAAVAFVVVCEQTETPAVGIDMPSIRLSGATGEIAAACKAAGITWKCVDADVVGSDGKPPPQLVPFLNEAKGRTLPWIVGSTRPDSSGKADIVFSRACPADVPGVLALLRGAKP